MATYILKRLGQGLLTVFLTVSTVFVLIRLAPGDPAVAYAGPLATNEQLAAVREQFCCSSCSRATWARRTRSRPRPCRSSSNACRTR
jgi:ABC-type dipeptide/oligopeptide/nickel transport system permease component